VLLIWRFFMKKSLFPLLLVVTALLMCVFFPLAHLDEVSGNRSLWALSPYVSFISEAGRYLATHAGELVRWAAYGSVGAIVILALLAKNASRRFFLFAVAIAILTQLILIEESLRLSLVTLVGLAQTPESSYQVALYGGVGGYSLVLLLIWLSFRDPNAPNFDQVRANSTHFGRPEFWTLFVVIVVGTLFRTYALNHHLNTFEGEIAPYSAGATSLMGMFYANRGYAGPWSPLGILYYLPIYLTTSLFGVNLHALRLSSALIGIATIPLVYLLANRIAGRAAALFAAALFALDCLHVGWSRSDVYPHGATTWPSVLMCFFLLRAAETRKLSWAIAVALMMGLSWHQYPSGQSAVVIPLIAIAMSLIFNRKGFALSGAQVFVIALGVLLWAIGLPLSYYPVDGQIKLLNPFTLTGPRALWSTEGVSPSAWQIALFVTLKSLRHFWDFTQGIFFRVPYLFHQEWLPYNPPLMPRSVPWFVASLSGVAAAILIRQRKRFETAVLCGWFVAAILPGILSDHAYPKRMSTTYPLIDILAGVAFAFILTNLKESRLKGSRVIASTLAIVALVSLTIYSTFLWFSGVHFKYGPPPEIAMAQELERVITPGTIVMAGLGGGYEPGKFLYLMLDHLTDQRARPNLYIPISNGGLETFVTAPKIDTAELSTSLPYTWTKLSKQLSETVSVDEWKNITFLILETLHNSNPNDRAISEASALCPSPIIRRAESSVNSREWKLISMVTITCPIAEMTKPLVIVKSPAALP
jgi:hypothetical protein